MRKHPGRWASLIVLTGVAVGGGVKGYEWWQLRKPHPRALVEERLISSKLVPPGLSKVVENKVQFGSLEIQFSAATAPLAAVAQASAAGVRLSPELPGLWKWQGDRKLVFTPKADWPPGADYTVSLDPAGLPKEVHLKDPPRWTFTTPALVAKWSEAVFYTDPKNPDVQQITADLTLTHPMNLDDVKRHLRITPLGTPGLFHFGGKAPAQLLEVTEDKESGQRHFWVRSARIVLPQKEDFVTITFDQGAVSSLGGTAVSSAVTAKVRVPDVLSGFHIAEVSTQLIRTDEGEPEQFLFIDTDGYATPEELARNVHAWYLAPGIEIKDTPVVFHDVALCCIHLQSLAAQGFGDDCALRPIASSGAELHVFRP